jgi:phage-related protein
MPPIEVVFYKDDDGSVPMIGWFAELSEKARIKCRARLTRLQSMGHELRRPESDYLRNGIYELRVGLHGLNFRMLYFFCGTQVVVISHGIIKEDVIPDREIEIAMSRKIKFEREPGRHFYKEL